ncbi:MAG TPA: elongation factor 4, partial [bacterium]|nr:elongation factor 4 [bacterium]
VPKVSAEIIKLLGCKESDIVQASGKTGAGVEDILAKVISEIPAPQGDPAKPLRALIFDSNYDEYKGVVAYIRVVDGSISKNNKIKLIATDAKSEALDVGIFSPDYHPTGQLACGQIGYIITGFKTVGDCRVGDTVTIYKDDTHLVEALQGYAEAKPMVYAGIFPSEGNNYALLRDGIEKLKLNDAALIYEPEQSQALGLGFRCGFLGLLHLEIFQERLRREHGLELIVTVPSVAYQIKTKGKAGIMTISSPQQLPDQSQIDSLEEPWVSLDVIVPKEYLGSVMALVQSKRGVYKNTEYIDPTRPILHYDLPMAAVLTDFYDKLKSVSSGYASINYDFIGYREADVVKMDIWVAEE